MQESNLKKHIHLHFIIFIWGFTAILGALISLDAIPLVWLRMGIGVLFMTAYFLIRNKSFKIDLKGLFHFFITGLIIAIHWIFFFKAIKVSNISVTLVMLSTGAFFTSFLEPLFFKRRLKSIEILLGLAMVVGLYVIFSFETQYFSGIVYASIASFLGALFSVLNGVYVKKYEPHIISFYQILSGTLIITIYLLVTGSITYSLFDLSALNWLYLSILGSVCTAYAFIVSVKLMKFLSPFTVMLSLNLEPVYGIVFALFIFGEKEQMNASFYYGASIVLGIVVLNGILKSKEKTKKKHKLL